jgi:4-hydroxythreonine-4-phosphate dehydrogenase
MMKVGEYAIKSFVAATKALKEGLVDVLSYSSNK